MLLRAICLSVILHATMMPTCKGGPQRVKCGCPFGLRSWVPEGGKPGEVRYRPARPPYIKTRGGIVVLGEDYMGIGWDGVAGRAL
jgi:hypothetical protein